MSVYGVTGSREIQSDTQRELIHQVVWGSAFTISQMERLVHGCCVGVDELCARIVAGEGPGITAVIPPNRRLVSDDAYKFSDEIVVVPAGPDGYKRRNQEIVNRSDVLLAFPLYPEHHPQSRRSGTWQTIRMARRKGIPVHEYVLSEVEGQNR